MAGEQSTPSQEEQAPARPQVVYVMGSGRSGSTILGVALGNCDGFFYAGEVDNWLMRSGTSAVGGLERTRFWEAVRAQVGDVEDLVGTQAQSYLERSSAVFRVGKGDLRRRLRERFGPVTEDIYRAIAQTAGASHIIDTSHFPLRARELKRLRGIDVHLILLVRDPQGVVQSFARDINRNDVARRRLRVLSTNADLWVTYLLSAIVFLRTPSARRLMLHHEDFLADPEGVLREILGFVGSNAQIPDLGALDTGFPLQGNRLIRTGTIALESKAPERPDVSRVTAVLQSPWTRLFERLQPRAGAR